MHSILGIKNPTSCMHLLHPQWHIGLQSNCQISCNATIKTTYMFASQFVHEPNNDASGCELIIPL